MYFIYNTIINVFLLISPLFIFFRIIKGKEDSKRYKEKFVIYSKKNNFKSIWFHAASVGELMSIIPLIKKLEKSKKILQIIVTTSTTSSASIFKKLKFKKTLHIYYPYDSNFLTNKFIKNWRPQVAIFVDSEIWPNMFNNLDIKKIPLILLNARITKKSFNRWKILKNFSAEIFNKIKLALPSNLETKKYLNILGVKNIKIAGNLKYYGQKKRGKSKLISFKKNFKNFKVWCAASTHENEEVLIAKLHKIIKKNKKNLLTIIIPRHVNRSEKIFDDLVKENLKVIRHSSKEKLKHDTDIYIVDVYGEVSKFYNISKITFVGGSIVKHGGQNPLEPARFGNHIINGPNVENFKEIYKFLKKNKISKTTSNINKMKNIIENKIDKKLSKKNIQKIFSKGDKILNRNYFYILNYIK